MGPVRTLPVKIAHLQVKVALDLVHAPSRASLPLGALLETLLGEQSPLGKSHQRDIGGFPETHLQELMSLEPKLK